MKMLGKVVARAALAAVMTSTALIFVSPTPAQAATVLSRVEIRGHDGRCVQAIGNTEGAAVQMWGCAHAANQRWNFWSDGAISSVSSGKCLTADSNTNGRNLVVRTCGGASGQVWSMANLPVVTTTSTGRGVGKTIRLASGKCLDVEGPFTPWGTPAQIWDCVAVDQQLFMTVTTQIFTANGSFHLRWQEATRSEALCFSNSSCQRKSQLIARKQGLLEQYATWSIFLSSLETDHSRIGNFLTALANSVDLSTTEKVFIWDLVVESVGRGLVINATHSQQWVRDSFFPGETHVHTAVTFWDGYHGRMVDFTLQDAFGIIWQHEEEPVGPVNNGDVEASLRQVIALNRFYLSGSSFTEFTRYWNALMRDDGANWCPNRIYENRCAVLGLGPFR